MKDTFTLLRDKIDGLSFGFMAGNGADISLLKSKFTEEDAQYALALAADRFESAAELAADLGKPEMEVAEKLEDMAQRGLIFFKREGEEKVYRLMPFLFGILEFNLHRKMDDVSMRNLRMSEWGGFMWGTDTPMFHYVPVNNELVVGNQILPRDDAWQIIDGKDPDHIALADCACRFNANKAGRPCKHPGFEETCLYFGDFADYFVERGDARYVTKKFAKDLIKKAEKEGLLLETVNTQASAVECICMCCSCCCGPLNMLRGSMATSKSLKLASNYCVELDTDKCIGCSACVERCPLGAMKVEDGVCVCNYDICVGCGLCISTCGGQALTLHQKAEEKLNPCDSADIHELHERMQAEYRARVDK